MPSLQKLNPRYEMTLLKEPVTYFKGVVFPADEGSIPSYDFVYPRLLLRVTPKEPVTTGDVIVDPVGRHLLVGDHDQSLAGNTNLYRTYRLFQLTEQVSWKRSGTTIEPLTGLKKVGTPTEMGPIWVSVELYGRETPDPGIRVKEEIRRMITGSPIQLGDSLASDQINLGGIVKRLNKIFGVWLAEVE